MRFKSRADRKRAAYGEVFATAKAAFRAKAKALLVQLAHGEIDTAEFAKGFLDLLTELHTQASFAGRGVGSTFSGATVSLGEVDRLAGAWMSYEQSPYVRKFRQALESGLYDSRKSHDLDPERAMSRVDLYADRANGTANQAMIQMLGDDEKIYWRLVDAEHCADCPGLADGSPYTRKTLPCVPKDGSTECGEGCQCYLEIDGVEIRFSEDPPFDDPWYDGR